MVRSLDAKNRAAKQRVPHTGVKRSWPKSRALALARLEAALDLVDHIDPALAADQAVGAMAAAQRFQRVTDLHGTILIVTLKGRGSRPNLILPEPANWDFARRRGRPGTGRFLRHLSQMSTET